MEHLESGSLAGKIIYQNWEILKLGNEDFSFVKTLPVVRIWRRGIIRSQASASPKHNPGIIRPTYDPTLLLKAKEWTKTLENKSENTSSRILSLLNKLAPSNRIKLQEQLYLISIENEGNLKVLVEKIFQKACLETKILTLWADLCEFFIEKFKNPEDGKKNCFRSELLLMSQNMFEELGKGLEFEGILKKRIMGNMAFVAELFKHHIIPKTTISTCLKTLLSSSKDEDSIEAAVNLIKISGKMIYRLKSDFKEVLSRISVLENTQSLPSRIRFMLTVIFNQDILESFDKDFKNQVN
jgi:hypothetical protein